MMLGWWKLPGRALLKSFARLHNGRAMLLGPDPNAAESFSEAVAKVCQLVLDSGRDDWKHCARNKPVRFHLAHRLGQHLLAHSSDKFTQTRESQAAVFCERLQNEHRPLIGDASDDLPNERLQFRIILFRQYPSDCMRF